MYPLTIKALCYMKKHLLLCSLLAVSLLGLNNKVEAQPPTPYAPDISLEDINGNTETLYSYLDEGKYVVLDFFATSSTPSLDSREGLQNLWNMHGPDGDDTAMIFSLEIDPETTNEATVITDYGIEYPVFTELSGIADTYGIPAFPMFIVVCPDRTWKIRTGGIQWDQSLLTSLALTCDGLGTFDNDAKILSYNGEEYYCQNTANASVYIQNMGLDTLKSAKIYAYNGTDLLKSINWQGELLQYEMIPVPMVLEGLLDDTNVKFEVEFPNLEFDENTSNDVLFYNIKEATVSSPELELRLNTDLKASETSWSIKDFGGAILFESDELENNTFYLEEFSIPESGCYTFEINDAFGDGLINGFTVDGPADGFIEFRSLYAGIIFTDISYEAGTIIRFTVDANLLDIEDNLQNQFSLSPNPANSNATITYSDTFQNGGRLSIIDAMGRMVYQNQLPKEQNELVLDLSLFAKGLYIVRMENEVANHTERLIISK